MPAISGLTHCRDLIGERLSGHDGTTPAGVIDDIVLDPRSGRAAYVVLMPDDAAADAQGVLIPWTLLEFDGNGQLLRLGATWERVEGAPSMVPGQTASTVSRDWEQRLHEHYESTPYWDGVDMSAS